MRTRLDLALVDQGFFSTRSRARDAIVRGCVSVNQVLISKPSHPVSAQDILSVNDPAQTYVSRAALKLKHGLEHFRFDAGGKACLDLGASTGGFTQVLLEAGAAHIDAIDVGHDQIHESLQGHKNITIKEGLNARDLKQSDLTFPPEAIVCDLSFISLRQALPPVLQMAKPSAWGIFLFKPQFEVGRKALNQQGQVKDKGAIELALTDFRNWFVGSTDWYIEDIIDSPIKGGEGACEFLIGACNASQAIS